MCVCQSLLYLPTLKHRVQRRQVLILGTDAMAGSTPKVFAVAGRSDVRKTRARIAVTSWLRSAQSSLKFRGFALLLLKMGMLIMGMARVELRLMD